MKKFLFLFAAFVFTLAAHSDTIPEGNISGTWTLSHSPYLVNGNTTIPDGCTLTIEAGVVVEWLGSYSMNVQGQIIAVGEANNPILFTASDHETGFRGIRFLETDMANDTSRFQFCVFEYGNAVGNTPDNTGGAIAINDFGKIVIDYCRFENNRALDASIDPNPAGGAIIVASGSPIITNCLFVGNESYSGGALFCYDGAHPLIMNNVFSENYARGENKWGQGYGGAICGYSDCDPIIRDNIFKNNVAYNGGGGLAMVSRCSPLIGRNLFFNNNSYWIGGAIELQDTCSPQIISNTIAHNQSTTRGGGIDIWDGCTPEIRNTILWGNTAVNGEQVYIAANSDTAYFYYSDIEGGQGSVGGIGNIGDWVGCITDDPKFVGPNSGNYHLSMASPCVDKGDPTSLFDPDETICDIGRYSTFQGSLIRIPEFYADIQEGIHVATDGDTVLVSDGTYYENMRFLGKAIMVSSEYLTDRDSSHIVNTIIDGSLAADPDSAACVMFVNGEDTTSVINGFTITGGSGVKEKALGVKSGGGIYCYNSGCKIMNNWITDNHVEGDSAGGAGLCCIMLEGDHWSVIDKNTVNYNTSTSDGFSAFGGGMSVLTNSVIKNNIIEYNTCTNTVGSVDGGGIEIEQWPGLNPTSTIIDNIIRYNEIVGDTNASGAGIMDFGIPVLIEGNIIEGNSGTANEGNWGGGITAWNVNGEITLTSNIIKDNAIEADYCYGVGVQIYNSQVIKILDNDIRNNSGHGNTVMAGGGVWIHTANDTVLIEKNILQNNAISSGSNSVGGGAGIYITNNNRVIFSRNQVMHNAARYGGGFYAFNSFNSNIVNNLFNDNVGTYGGAIYFRQYDGKNLLYGSSEKNPDYQERIQSERADPIPLLINNNFYGNNAVLRGGAISSDHVNSVPIIFNSIFWENTANSGKDLYNSSSNEMLVYNNDIDTSMIYTPWTGEDNIFCDPALEDDSLHLAVESLCLNAGIESLIVNEETFHCPPVDIDGEERPFDWTMPDIGADEAQWYYVQVDEKLLSKQGLEVYPNPFSSNIAFAYTLDDQSSVSVEIIDVTGQLIKTILNETKAPGEYQADFDGSFLPPGMYFIVLKTNQGMRTTKLIKL